MKYKYICEKCSYGTNRKYNYNKHIDTQKHKDKIATFDNVESVKSNTIKSNYDKNEENVVKTEENMVRCGEMKHFDYKSKSYNNDNKKFLCKYCNKFKAKSNRARHYKLCKAKIEHEQTQKNLIKLLKEENKKKDEYITNLIKTLVGKNNGDTNITNNTTNNTTINDHSLNMFYVINNFKEAHNFEDLMDAPLTMAEKEYIINNGSIVGCYKLLKSRCIDDLDLDKRPFHCLDGSRSKYLLRTKDDWSVDQKGEKILNTGYSKMKDVYCIDNFNDTEKFSNNMKQLLALEGLGRKKIIKELNKQTLLKNTVKNK